MNFIRIDLKTIKPNPNAGKDNIAVQGPKEVIFTTSIPTEKWPRWLAKEGISFVTSWQVTCAVYKIEAILIDLSKEKQLYDWAMQNKHRVEITMYSKVQKFYHAPEPSLLYKYENPLVQCSECLEFVKVNSIEFSDPENDDPVLDKCPKCGELDSFDIKIETLDQALERQNAMILNQLENDKD